MVVDFSQLAQGPFATQILGDLGADVIKIEPPSGDWMRSFSLQNAYPGGESVSFLSYNRNKRSIALDLKNPVGTDIARRIIERADVLVENFRPGVMDRLGLGYLDSSSRNPRLIYCASVGYGQDGPYKTRPGQDLLVQSLGGMASITGRSGDPPTPAGIGLADLTAGLHIAYGVLAALVARARTGRGQRVDVSMLSSLLAMQGQELASYLHTGTMAERASSGLASAYAGAPLGIYPTADGWIALSMQPIDRLAGLLGVTGFEGEATSNLIADRDEVKRRLEAGTRKRTTREWLEFLLAHDVWCAPVNDFEGVVADPQVRHEEMIVNVSHPSAGDLRLIGIPVKFSETPGSIRRPPPRLGEHALEVLREYASARSEEIESIRASGAVVGWPTVGTGSEPPTPALSASPGSQPDPIKPVPR